MSGSAVQLYEEDFVRWTEQQSSALREAAGAGTNLPLDWENLAEEIESLGRSQRHELHSRIAGIPEHLLKLDYSRANDPRRGWIETVARQRAEIELLLKDSPSLRRDVARIVTEEGPRVCASDHPGFTYTARMWAILRRRRTLKTRCSATGSRGMSLSPPAGRGTSLRRAIYPRCLRKKAATGSKEALVERFSLST